MNNDNNRIQEADASYGCNSLIRHEGFSMCAGVRVGALTINSIIMIP